MQQVEQTLSFASLVFLITGNMIGVGFLLVPSLLAKIGSIGIVAWGVTAVCAGAISLIFVDLSSAFPNQTMMEILRSNIGPMPAYQSIFIYAVATALGDALIMQALSDNLCLMMNISSQCAHLIVIGLMIALTLLRVKDPLLGLEGFQAVAFFSRVMIFIPLLLVGMHSFDHQLIFSSINVTSGSALQAFGDASVIVLWTFIGLESILFLGKYAKNHHELKRATTVSLCITTLIYLTSIILIMGNIDMVTLSMTKDPFAMAIEPLMGSNSRLFIQAMCVLTCLGSLQGWLLSTYEIALSLIGFYGAPTKQQEALSVCLISLFVMAVYLLLEGGYFHLYEYIFLLVSFSAILPYFYSVVSHGMVFHKNRKIYFYISCAYTLYTAISCEAEVLYTGMILLMVSSMFYMAGKNWWRERDSNPRITE